MNRPIPFGKYLLLERVNVGGMAEVFKAKVAGTPGFERLVAIKRIQPALGQDPEFVRMFMDEARLAQRLDHPGIVPIHELGRVGHSPFLAMDYVRGPDLRSIFQRMHERGQRVPAAMACHVLMRACDALHHAHELPDEDGRPLGIVHRDVSPQNVLVSTQGEVKLIDFGVAKAANQASKTQVGMLKGKYGYMSPEQVRGLPLDRRSDVFSAGIVLYELLTGERLFVGATDFSTLEKVRNVDIQPPSEVAAEIPAELEAIVLRALSRDPDDRYQTAMDLHDDLQAHLYSSGTFFGPRDLSTWVGEVFSRDIEAERVRDEQFRLLEEEMADDRDKLGEPDTERQPVVPEQGRPGKRPPPRKKTMVGMGAPPQGQPAPAQAAPPGGLDDWDDDDMATQVYDKSQHGPSAPSEPPPPPVSKPTPAPAAKPAPASGRASKPGRAPAPPPRQESVPPPRPRRAGPGPATQPAEPAPPSVEVRDDEPPLRGDPTIEDRPGAAPPPDPGQAAPAPPRPRRRRSRERTEVLERPSQSNTGTLVAMIAMGALMLVGLGIGAWALLGPKDPGTIQLVTKPPDATVLLDEEPVAATASPFLIRDVAPETVHLIEVRKEGYKPWSMQVNLEPGEKLELPPVDLVAIAGGEGVAGAPEQLEGAEREEGKGAAPEPEAGSGKAIVHFHSEPEGAKVHISRGDEQRVVGFTPTWARMVPEGGPWTIRISNVGYETWEKEVELPEGTEREQFKAVLTRKDGAQQATASSESAAARRRRIRRVRARRRAAQQQAAQESKQEPKQESQAEPEKEEPAEEKATASGDGTLRISTRPWTNVSVDGRSVGATPQMNLKLPPGRHTIRLTNPEFDIDKTLTIKIEPGKTVTKILTLTP